MNKKTILLLAIAIIGIQLIGHSQSMSNALSDANTATGTATTSLKTLFARIFMLVGGGAVVYTGVVFFFVPDRAKNQTVTLIGGLAIGAIGAIMGYIS